MKRMPVFIFVCLLTYVRIIDIRQLSQSYGIPTIRKKTTFEHVHLLRVKFDISIFDASLSYLLLSEKAYYFCSSSLQNRSVLRKKENILKL